VSLICRDWPLSRTQPPPPQLWKKVHDTFLELSKGSLFPALALSELRFSFFIVPPTLLPWVRFHVDQIILSCSAILFPLLELALPFFPPPALVKYNFSRFLRFFALPSAPLPRRTLLSLLNVPRHMPNVAEKPFRSYLQPSNPSRFSFHIFESPVTFLRALLFPFPYFLPRFLCPFLR